jgi:hypothetical protein
MAGEAMAGEAMVDARRARRDATAEVPALSSMLHCTR